MCGYILTNKSIKDLKYINYYLQKRGPDYTNIKCINNINIIHNLLSLTGKFTIQPFVDDDFICLFNGEIYNYEEFDEYHSDGECILPNFKTKKLDFFKKIDGEFAVTIYDFKNRILYLATDLFATKPLFYSIEKNEIGVSTYESCLKRLKFSKITKVQNNSFLKIDLKSNKIISHEIYQLEFNRQFKNDFSDWNKAFKNSIIKRANSNHKKFIALSSGHDSGAIACALNEINEKYTSYTIKKNENLNVLNERIKKIKLTVNIIL